MSLRFYSGYEPKERVYAKIEGPSLTKQSFKEECDVNHILDRYMKTGLIEHANTYRGEYGDFVDALDYREAVDVILESREMFSALPAKVRLRFNNDPGEFLGFVENPANYDEMVSLGLVNAPDVDPEKVTVTEAAKS